MCNDNVMILDKDYIIIMIMIVIIKTKIVIVIVIIIIMIVILDGWWWMPIRQHSANNPQFFFSPWRWPQSDDFSWFSHREKPVNCWYNYHWYHQYDNHYQSERKKREVVLPWKTGIVVFWYRWCIGFPNYQTHGWYHW